MLVRKRKLKISAMHTQETMEPINKRYEKRETKREAKALLAAKLENAIEKELLNRLQAGTYKDIYNLEQEDFNKALDVEEIQADEFEVDEDLSDEDDDSLIGGDLEGGESEMSEGEIAELEAEQALEMQEMGNLEDSLDEDEAPKLGKRGRSEGKSGKGVSVSYEYEFEEEHNAPQKNKSVEKLS